jgi:hypothetical protein
MGGMGQIGVMRLMGPMGPMGGVGGLAYWGEMTDLGRGSAELAESPPKKRFVGEIKP